MKHDSVIAPRGGPGPGGVGVSATGSDVPAVASLPFEQVYREHALRVYQYCLSQVGNVSDAEDLAAEVFAAAFAAYEAARLDGRVVLPWLLRIARNEVIDYRRRRTRRSALLLRFFGGTSELDGSPDVEGAVVVRDELRRVVAAMTRLSDRDSTLIGLRLAAGLPYAEIGTVVGVSQHAATVATKRALQRLRRHLEVPSVGDPPRVRAARSAASAPAWARQITLVPGCCSRVA